MSFIINSTATTEIYTLSLHDALPILQNAMAVHGSCHCGNVQIELPSAPEWVADCNCSLCRRLAWRVAYYRSEEHTSELQSHVNLVCRLLLEKKKILSIHNQ